MCIALTHAAWDIGSCCHTRCDGATWSLVISQYRWRRGALVESLTAKKQLYLCTSEVLEWWGSGLEKRAWGRREKRIIIAGCVVRTWELWIVSSGKMDRSADMDARSFDPIRRIHISRLFLMFHPGLTWCLVWCLQLVNIRYKIFPEITFLK